MLDFNISTDDNTSISACVIVALVVVAIILTSIIGCVRSSQKHNADIKKHAIEQRLEKFTNDQLTKMELLDKVRATMTYADFTRLLESGKIDEAINKILNEER